MATHSIRYYIVYSEIYTPTIQNESIFAFPWHKWLCESTKVLSYTFIACGGAVGWGTVLQAWRSRVRFPMVSLEFFIVIILPAATVAVGLTQSLTEMSTRNISWGGKGGRCVGLTTLPPSCADCKKSGSVNLLEHSGPVQACNGIALSFYTYSLASHNEQRPLGWDTVYSFRNLPTFKWICCLEFVGRRNRSSLLPWRRSQYIPPKLHAVTYQITVPYV